MRITVTRVNFDAALGIAGKHYFLSSQVKAVQQALTNYETDHNNPGLEPAARNALIGVLYLWKQQKPKEFEKYDSASDGAVRKLSVQAGLDDFRPPPPTAVRLAGNLQAHPTRRTDAVPTPLSTDLASLLVDYVVRRRKVAVLVIDLYGDDFQQQGLNDRLTATPSTVADNIENLLSNTRAAMGNGQFEHLPVYICCKNVTPQGAELVGQFRNAISSCYVQIIRSTTSSVLIGTPLLGDLQANHITDVFVTGFDANLCVATSIFGNGHVGAMYQAGLLDYGFNVLTSRLLVGSGGRALETSAGWPYMGRCNV